MAKPHEPQVVQLTPAQKRKRQAQWRKLLGAKGLARWRAFVAELNDANKLTGRARIKALLRVDAKYSQESGS